MARLLSRGGGRTSSLGTLKKVLLSMLVVGLLGTVTGRGVYASLNGEQTNTGSTASTGTLTISAQINGQPSACTSQSATSADNKNVACGSVGLLFNGSTFRWPGSGTSGDSIALSLTNTGSIPAQSIEVSMTCTNGNKSNGQTSTPVANLPGTEGTNSPCGVLPTDDALEFYIQENSSLGGPDLTNGCLYPDTASPLVVGQGNATDCTTQWTVNSLRSFRSKACWDLGPLPAVSSPATGTNTRYFTIGTRFPPDSDNSYQGTQAFITLKWHLVSNDPLYTPSCANDS